MTSAFEGRMEADFTAFERARHKMALPYRETYCLAWRDGATAALEAAKAQMPEQARISHSTPGARGWNECLSVMDERLSTLQEPDAREAKP